MRCGIPIKVLRKYIYTNFEEFKRLQDEEKEKI